MGDVRSLTGRQQETQECRIVFTLRCGCRSMPQTPAHLNTSVRQTAEPADEAEEAEEAEEAWQRLLTADGVVLGMLL